MNTPAFHAGEQAWQSEVGVRERLAAVGRMVIRDHMPDQHRELFGKLPTLLLAVQDANGQPWATMLQGTPGFIDSPDARTLRIHALPAADDPVRPWLTAGASVGLLGLEPHTRRRNRANGQVHAVGPDGIEVAVVQSFGNCPKYIHARRPQPDAALRPQAAEALGPMLDEAAIAWLRRADTFFIASASAARPGSDWTEGVDVSHRGGRPGFVHVTAHAAAHAVGGAECLRLTVPDYSGNLHFNTLGNLRVWPQAGLLVPDFDDGSLLQLAAEASVTTKGPTLTDHPGALRLLHLDVLGGWRRKHAVPLRWTTAEPPPQFLP